MFKQTRIALLGIVVLLVGCGGGGGGSSSPNLSYDGPTGAVLINGSNADAIAGYAASQATSGELTSATSNIPLGLSGPAAAGSGPQPSVHPLSELAKKYAAMALDRNTYSANLLPGVTESQSQDCSGGGTVTLTVTYADPNQPSVGDRVSIIFINCVEGSDRSNGTVTVVLKDVTVNPDQTLGDFAADFTFSNLKITDLATGDYAWLNGGFTAGFTGDGQTTPLVFSLSGSSLVVEEKTGAVTEQALLSNFSFVDTVHLNGDLSYDHDFTIASTEIGGSVTVVTENPFTIYAPDSYPTVGQLVVTGANNASVKLTAVDNTSVTIEYDLDGNGTYGDGTDPIQKTVAWSAL